ncbi:cysteine desulfurase [Mitosporidium daphniae]|uniref:Cysteine desulfurase, mitosomal n=1 Tax=Mitosporidium daphniae TaxID=1485682 RepID=A0A098VYU1_9MICR|nr:putative cysteine desulfurase Nfs1 [Mitosporidium daphniae]KGG52871.1 putative cysteine desulfurase Nfs1 [Mitosporidium daphniae]|eukprot:XP_013239298.1 putative cysteine desulfurase Nfs1 [Mitosporidium daphniae]
MPPILIPRLRFLRVLYARRHQSSLPSFGFELKRPTCNDDRPIYFDVQATTNIDPRVLDAMLPWMTYGFGNPHSRTHAYGWETEAAVEEARTSVASLIGASTPSEIIFTSGATESVNMAIRGIVRFYGSTTQVPHIITSVVEHKCVLDTCRFLEEAGEATITYLPVNKQGIVDVESVKGALRPETRLISIMAINNEIGSIQPITEIGRVARSHGAFFHCDAAQAVGKIPIDVEKSFIDLLSISGHKIYGPKGVGALFIRRRPRVRLTPLFTGGSQERSLRSGTIPAPLVIGLGAAFRVAAQEMDADIKHIDHLSNRLIRGLFDQLPMIERNGAVSSDGTSNASLYPGCVNISFSCVEGESLLMALKDVACSSGSACTSASLEPSYVLRALGTEEDMAHSSIRFGIGRFTTRDEVDAVTQRTVRHVRRLREISPLWEMIQQGIDLRKIQWTGH